MYVCVCCCAGAFFSCAHVLVDGSVAFSFSLCATSTLDISATILDVAAREAAGLPLAMDVATVAEHVGTGPNYPYVCGVAQRWCGSDSTIHLQRLPSAALVHR